VCVCVCVVVVVVVGTPSTPWECTVAGVSHSLGWSDGGCGDNGRGMECELAIRGNSGHVSRGAGLCLMERGGRWQE
jgi:hypothetical protein